MRTGLREPRRVDVAPTYGQAEARLKPWIEKYRDRFFLAEKTTKRKKEEVWEELRNSLRNIGAEYFDLYQFHSVNSMETLEQIFSRGGAMEAFKEARETGLVRYIGITGHADIRVLMKALDWFDFDTVLAPVNLASMVHPEMSASSPLRSSQNAGGLEKNGTTHGINRLKM